MDDDCGRCPGHLVYGVDFHSFLLYSGAADSNSVGSYPKKWFAPDAGGQYGRRRGCKYITFRTVFNPMILVTPLMRLIAGKSYGPTATIVALVIAAAPYVARMIESSLLEVDPGVIEAALSMGASTKTIILKVLIPEAKTSLIVGCTIVIGTILGYSAMAGALGGGGLGDIAIRYGYNRYQFDILIVTVILLVILVQIFQVIGMKISKKTDKRIRE